MQVIKFIAAKGGQGTTTVAVAFAAQLAAKGHRVALVGHDNDALAAVAGVASIPSAVASNLVIGQTNEAGVAGGFSSADVDYLVLDGTDVAGDVDLTYLVTRNCYLALRAATRTLVDNYAGIVLVEEPGRALGASDVEAVLGSPVMARIPLRADVARAVDAGVMLDVAGKREAFKDLGRLVAVAREV